MIGRRIAAAVLLAAYLLPSAASARVLVISDHANAIADLNGLVANYERQVKLFRSALDRGGVDYAFVEVPFKNVANNTAINATTDLDANGIQVTLASGSHVWNANTKGAYTEAFDAIVVLQGGPKAQPFRPESLTLARTGYVPQVPILYVCTNGVALESGNPNTFFNDATNCSTGVTGALNSEGKGAYVVGTTKPFLLSTYVEPVVFNSTTPAGGMRKLIGASAANITVRPPFRQGGPEWADSLVSYSTNPDTGFVWERLMNHSSGAKHLVFVNAGGAGLPASDSAGVSNPMAEGEVFLMMAGLARLDSLTGGKVFTKNRVPYRVAVTIDGGWCRNQRRIPRGFLAADSAVLKSTIDSLNALDIPAVLGVNVDSLADYPRDKTWWSGWYKLKYTPQNRGGLDSAAAGNGNASWQRPRDVWGRYRNRAAFGDTSAVGDTTVYGLLRASLYKCDSAFTSSKVSRFALAPDDDWSPKFLRAYRQDPPADSLLFAVARAGFRGIRINGQNRDADPAYLPHNPRGYYREQGWYTDRRGNRIKLLAHQGYGVSGGVAHVYTFSDSAGPVFDQGAPIASIVELNRAWTALTQDEDRNYDSFPYDNPSGTAQTNWYDIMYPSADVLYPVRKGNILRFSVADFSGNPSGPPARVGYWVLKSLKNQFDAINGFAGRTIIEFAYPEDVLP